MSKDSDGTEILSKNELGINEIVGVAVERMDGWSQIEDCRSQKQESGCPRDHSGIDVGRDEEEEVQKQELTTPNTRVLTDSVRGGIQTPLRYSIPDSTWKVTGPLGGHLF